MSEAQPKSDPEKDDPCRAPESGNPDEAGRSQGYVIDEFGVPAGQRDNDKGGDRDLESGRHGTK